MKKRKKPTVQERLRRLEGGLRNNRLLAKAYADELATHRRELRNLREECIRRFENLERELMMMMERVAGARIERCEKPRVIVDENEPPQERAWTIRKAGKK